MNGDPLIIIHKYPRRLEAILSAPTLYFNFEGEADDHIRFLIRAHPWLTAWLGKPWNPPPNPSEDDDDIPF